MLRMDDNLADALRRGDNALFVDRANAQAEFKPLLVSALEHVINGVTTIQEAIRVAQQFETDLPEVEGTALQEGLGSKVEGLESDDAVLSIEALN